MEDWKHSLATHDTRDLRTGQQAAFQYGPDEYSTKSSTITRIPGAGLPVSASKSFRFNRVPVQTRFHLT